MCLYLALYCCTVSEPDTSRLLHSLGVVFCPICHTFSSENYEFITKGRLLSGRNTNKPKQRKPTNQPNNLPKHSDTTWACLIHLFAELLCMCDCCVSTQQMLCILVMWASVHVLELSVCTLNPTCLECTRLAGHKQITCLLWDLEICRLLH